MDKRLKGIEDIPCFCVSMVMYLPVATALGELFARLGAECLYKQYNDVLEVTICKVEDVVCWEVSEVLDMLFKKCSIEKVEIAAKEYKGTIFIDISFVHREKYPVLIFEGSAMQVIHQLQAEIGIDPY